MTNAGGLTSTGEVTRLLRSARGGDRASFDALFEVVHDELRRVARQQLARGGSADTIRATELVNELYLKLVDHVSVDWESRAHFYGIAARAMRQILVDLARGRKAAKRGGGWARTTLTGEQVPLDVRLDEVLALNDVLDKLDERQRQVVEYRFFAGMSEEEIAQVLGVSARTVQREWVKARAWLYQALYAEGA
jgi:RNA polymerase sigma factor (TIGR02999 family)